MPALDVRLEIIAVTQREGFVGLAVVVVFVLLILALEWVPSLMTVAESHVLDLNARQEKAIDIYVATTQQLMTLGTLVIAAAGASSFGRAKGRMLLALAALMAALSIYFGYVSMSATVWMLNAGFFNLDAFVVGFARQLQFWLFLGSVTLVFTMWLRTGTP